MDINRKTRAIRRLTSVVGRRKAAHYHTPGPVLGGWVVVYYRFSTGLRPRWLSMTGRARLRYTCPRVWSDTFELLTPSDLEQLTTEYRST